MVQFWRLRLDVGEDFFTRWVAEQHDRPPREAVESPSMEAVRTRLDKVMANLICFWTALFLVES